MRCDALAPVTVSIFVAIAKVRESDDPLATVAGRKLLSPGWDAVMVHVPLERIRMVSPETISHTPDGDAVIVIGKSEDAVALAENVPSPYVLLPIAAKVNSCSDLSTVMVMGEEERVRKFALSALVAITVHVPARRAVNVVPEMAQIPPLLVTAYETTPSPDPPREESEMVGSFGVGIYVTVLTDGTAVMTACVALLIVRFAAV